MIQIEHQFTKVNGLFLHSVAAGPTGGRLIVFLHGFPEFWYSWKEQIPFFAAQGFRVLAPDQRGYNLSERPAGIRAYRLEALAADIAALIQAAGRQSAIVVGHDWGGAVAWHLAKRYREQVERLVILNAPHPQAMRDDLRRNPLQWRRSAYMAFFQLPRLPEWLSSLAHWSPTCSALRHTSRPGTFTPADFQEYRRAWSQPGAFTAMLNWYRAALRFPAGYSTDPYIHVPTLILWGQKDAFLGIELARASQDLCGRSRLIIFHQASHWLQREEPEQVNHLIHTFISE